MRHAGWVFLDPVEFFLLWTGLDLGDLPAVLDIPHVGRTAAVRARLVDTASDALADRGLGTVERPAADVEALLCAFDSPDRELDLELTGEGVDFRGLGAVGRGGEAVVGVVGGEVRLGPVGAAAQPAELLAAAEALPAGSGWQGNVRADDYLRACEAGREDGAGGFLDVLERVGLRQSEALTFLRVVTGSHAGGTLGASVRTRDGRRVRTPAPVGWVDTDEGRYAVRRGGDWVTVTPVDPPRLLAMVEDMVADLAQRRP